MPAELARQLLPTIVPTGVNDQRYADDLMRQRQSASVQHQTATVEGGGKATVIAQIAMGGIADIAKRLNFDYMIYMSYSIDFRRKVISTREEKG